MGDAKSIDDFYGRDGIFARLFSKTIEQILEGELTAALGYDRYEAEGRNSGNSRNGHSTRKMRTSSGDKEIRLPRDRNGEFQSELLKKNSNEIEEKVMAMYAKGNAVRDIQDMLRELDGIEVSPDSISKITDKVWPLVEAWQNRPLVLEGHREVLEHWIGEGVEGANFWPSVITDLQNRGVQDVIAEGMLRNRRCGRPDRVLKGHLFCFPENQGSALYYPPDPLGVKICHLAEQEGFCR